MIIGSFPKSGKHESTICQMVMQSFVDLYACNAEIDTISPLLKEMQTRKSDKNNGYVNDVYLKKPEES